MAVIGCKWFVLSALQYPTATPPIDTWIPSSLKPLTSAFDTGKSGVEERVQHMVKGCDDVTAHPARRLSQSEALPRDFYIVNLAAGTIV